MTIEKSRFHQFIIKQNNFDRLGFENWVFYPGMLFNDHHKWWSDAGIRRQPHEGVDFCFYRDTTGGIRTIGYKTKIPALYDGRVAHIHNDFLGKSIYVQHNTYDERGHALFTIYGHTIPVNGLNTGDMVSEGNILATTANVREHARILPHVHITVAWIPVSFPHERLTWKMINAPQITTLCNPLEFIDCKFTVEREWVDPEDYFPAKD